MHPPSDLAFTISVRESLHPLPRADRVLAEKLVAYRDRKRDPESLPEPDGRTGPAVGVTEEAEVLVSAGEVRVGRDQGRSLPRVDLHLIGRGHGQRGRPLHPLDRRAVTAGQVVEPPRDRHRVGGLERFGRRVDQFERLLDVRESPGVGIRHECACSQRLQSGTVRRFGRERERPLKVLAGPHKLSPPHERPPDRLLQRDALLRQVERLGTFERPRVGRDRFVIRIHQLGRSPGLSREREPPAMVTRLDVMMRQGLGGYREAVAQTIESLRRPQVEPAAADRVHLLVEDLTDLVVREREGIIALHRDQLCGAGLIQRIENRLFSPVACGDQELREVEDLSHNCGGTEDVIALRADAIETISDRGLHALRDRQFGDLVARPRPALTPDGPLLDERLQHFLNEERVSLGLLLDRRRELQAHILAQERAHLRSRLLDRKAAQRDAGRQPLAVPVDQRLRQGVSAVELGLAVGGGDEDAFLPEVPQEMAQEPEGAAVGPVEVVDVEEQAALGRQLTQDLRNSVEEEETLFPRRQRQPLRERAEARL